MTRKFWFGFFVCVFALISACARQAGNPVSPSATAPGFAGAAADGTTLKASAPVPQSPINASRIEQGSQPTLVITNSTLTYATGVTLTYKFEVYNAAGTRVYESPLVTGGSAATTSHIVTGALEGDQTYSWRARAELAGTIGPWSSLSNATFIVPANTGFLRGNELYDPLINGRTVGEIHGPVTFLPGVGVRLEDYTSYISYELPQTLFEGEFSLVIGNIKSYMAGAKTKVFAMGKGYDDIIVNEYRATIEKRGNGDIAWRFIARDDQIDTEGAEREYLELDRAHTYLWQATWRSNRFDLEIFDAPGNGARIYSKGKNWQGRGYEPNPHVIYVGAPTGRSGPDSATVPGMVVRQVWVSSRPRPASANQ